MVLAYDDDLADDVREKTAHEAAADYQAKKAPRSDGRGNFFAIDIRAFNRVVPLGMNPMVAYLVLAAGSGVDQSTTKWSARSIEQRMGIGWPRAKEAIQLLIEKKLVQQVKAGKFPQYKIATNFKDGTHEWVWLPNELVAPADGSFAPLERLRRTRNVNTIALLVDLYDAHAIGHEGGIDWRLPNGIVRKYEREKLGERGEFIVWTFEPARVLNTNRRAPFARRFHNDDNGCRQEFWDCLQAIEDAGFLEFIPHVVDSDKPDGEVIFSLAPHEHGKQLGEQIERDVYTAAYNMAEIMVGEGVAERIRCGECPDIIVPMRRSYTEVAVVGICRLRFRPKTSVTADFYRNLMDRCEIALAFYAELQQRYPG